MPRAVHIATPMPTLTASSKKSGDRPLNPIALFGGIGLLVFLVAIVTGVQGVWY